MTIGPSVHPGISLEHFQGHGRRAGLFWENVDGRGATLAERMILDARLGGHEAVVGDVDGGGDLDLYSKVWQPARNNANGGRNHFDYLENRLEDR